MATMNDTPAASKATRGAPLLFSINGKYQVSSGTTLNDLQNDVGCWLEAIHGMIDMTIDGLLDEGGQIAANPRMVARALYGALYQLEMVQGALSASYEIQQREVEA